MKAVLRVYIDPKTGEPIPLPWFGEGEPPALVEPETERPVDEKPPIKFLKKK